MFNSKFIDNNLDQWKVLGIMSGVSECECVGLRL